MARCDACGKEIGFIKRKEDKALVVNLQPIYFLPDLSGDTYYVHGKLLRRGRRSLDGLKGYTLHNCEVR